MSGEVKLFDPQLLSKEQLETVIDIVKSTSPDDPNNRVRALRFHTHVNGTDSVELHRLSVTCSILADLVDQGWRVFEERQQIFIQSPPMIYHKQEDIKSAKARFRESLYRSSNRQIAAPSVNAFIEKMEVEKDFEGREVSVLSLIEDGAEFSEQLREISVMGKDEALKTLQQNIKPFIQVCSDKDRCSKTGLRLLDVWRYYRYTWSLEYNSVPGRTVRVLIRNKAKKNWPIIGIAMIASPAANMYARDSWIGWRTDDLISKIISGEWEPRQIAKSLLSVLRDSIGNIREDDLIEKNEIENPTISTFFKLEQIIAKATSDRASDLQAQTSGNLAEDRLVDIRDYKSKDQRTFTDEDWRSLSATSLFTKKRAEQLLPLLKTLDYLKRADFETDPSSALMETLVSSKGRRHISFALNEIRKLKLSSEIADISVCGAISPYNEILGGKLVTLIMASQEVREAYKKRYSNQPSEIASQIAGRKLVRNSELKVVTTTSLYGVGSSQYNRLKLSAENHSHLKNDVKWEELAMSEGFSVTHVSFETVERMRALAKKVYGRRRINSVFGEGSSPRTRQIRSGLNLIGISDEGPLTHAVGRRVYACELYPGARRTLIGLTGNSRKLRSHSIKDLTKAWLERWVLNRIKREETLEAISEFKSEDISSSFKNRIKSVRLEDTATYGLSD